MMANKFEDEVDMMSNGLQMSYIRLINDILTNKPDLAEHIQSLPDKIRVARSNKTENSVITFIKQGWIKKFIKYTNGASSEIEFENAIKLLEADENDSRIDIPKDYFTCLQANKKTFDDIIKESLVQGMHESSSPNEKKVRKYLRALLAVPTLSTQDHEYLEKIDAAIKRGSLNGRIMKDVKNEIEKGNKAIDQLVHAFKKIIDDVYLVERKNYDVTNSLKKPEVIVLSECLAKEN